MRSENQPVAQLNRNPSNVSRQARKRAKLKGLARLLQLNRRARSIEFEEASVQLLPALPSSISRGTKLHQWQQPTPVPNPKTETEINKIHGNLLACTSVIFVPDRKNGSLSRDLVKVLLSPVAVDSSTTIGCVSLIKSASAGTIF